MKPTCALCDQVTRIDKSPILRATGVFTAATMARIDAALRLALEI